MINLSVDNPVIVVKPDYNPIVVTGSTPTILIGSGSTNVEKVGLNTWIIHSVGSTGSTGQTGSYIFSGITPTQVTTQQVGNIITISIYSPSGHTGAQGLKGDKGDTGAQGTKGDKGDKGDTGSQGVSGITPTLVFTGSGGTTVTYSKAGTTYNISVHGAQGIQGIQGVKGDKGDTGAQGVSGNSAVYTFHASGATTISAIGAGTNPITIYSPIHVHDVTGGTNLGTGHVILSGVTANKLNAKSIKVVGNLGISHDATSITISGGTTGSLPWSSVTAKPSWLSGTTVGAFQNAHTHTNFNADIDFGGKKLRNVSDPATGATGGGDAINRLYLDNKLYTLSATTLPATYNTKSVFNTYTGTTAPAAYASKTNAITGGTNLGSGKAIFSGVTANKINVKSIKVLGGLTISHDTTSITISGGTGGGSDATKLDKIATIVQKTGTTYTALSTDSAKILEFTGTGATTITLPTGLTTGYQITVVNYGGATSGTKTFAAGTGASIKSRNSATKLATQYDAATAYYRGSNIWVIIGDLTS